MNKLSPGLPLLECSCFMYLASLALLGLIDHLMLKELKEAFNRLTLLYHYRTICICICICTRLNLHIIIRDRGSEVCTTGSTLLYSTLLFSFVERLGPIHSSRDPSSCFVMA